jgi:aspartyl protease family protein
MAGRAAVIALLGLALLGGRAWGQTVAFNGSLGSKAALLLIDGEPRTVAVGASVAGVKLLALGDGQATIEFGGKRQTLLLGASPGRVGDARAGASTGRQIVLSSGPGGHFIATGSINGLSTQFLVDTGATAVAIAQGEAERLGLKFREGRRIMTQTANGTVPAHLLQLALVRIGDVEVRNVDAIVVPGQMSHVLLGNSFLTRFQMRRENDLMTLDLRY